MNKLFITLSLFALVISFFFCEKTITDFEFEAKPPKLVVNSILNPDSAGLVHLSKSMRLSLNEKTPGKIENPLIELFDGEKKYADFENIDGWNFKSKGFFPQEGKIYTLKVSAESYEPVSAQTEIPFKPLAVDINYEFTDGVLVFELGITDSLKPDNYYWIEIQSLKKAYLWSDTEGLAAIDSINSWEPAKIYTRSPYVSFRRYLDRFENQDAKDYEEYGDAFIIKSDKIKSEKFSVKVSVKLNDLISNNENNTTIKVIAEKLSKPYYEHLQSLALYSESYIDPFIESASIFINVENGLGVFGAKAGISKVLDLSEIVKE
jgi:hypothetical protein